MLKSIQEAKMSGSPSLDFPSWSPHWSWQRAIRELNVSTQSFIYSSHLFTPILRHLSSPLLKNLFGKKEFLYASIILSEKPWDRNFRQHQLIKKVVEFQPELIVIDGGPGLNVLGHKVWFKIKSQYPKIHLILINGMNPYYPQAICERRILPLVDIVVTNDTSFADIWNIWGAKKAIALPMSACDDKNWLSETGLDKTFRPQKSDIVFIGSLEPVNIYHERIKILRSIADFDLAIYGSTSEPLEKISELKRLYRGSVSGIEQKIIYQNSKIALNIHGQTSMPNGANIRTFEIPASGCFQLADHVMDGMFEPEKEIVYFHNTTDLREKIAFYLAHDDERRRISEAGRKKVLNLHTYVHRFQKIISVVSKEKELNV